METEIKLAVTDLHNCLQRVGSWVEDHEYKGYEPFDGLSSNLRSITFGNLLLERILLQLVRQSPVNLRPLFKIKPLDSTIGRGYMAWGYLKMFKITGNESYKKEAIKCLDWLISNKSPQYLDYCWGKHFDFAGRAGSYPKYAPITIWSALICQSFLEGYEILQKQKYLEVADSVCRWFCSIPRYEVDGGLCLSYTGTGDLTTIHNHNMYAAAVLARTAKHTKNLKYNELAMRMMDYSCSKQRADGSWYYGEYSKFHWIDNFHTGYNLDALKYYLDYTEDQRFREKLITGLTFYKLNFFDESGRAKYYHNRTYPIDSQCAAQGIDTLALLSDVDTEALQIALKVAKWWIANMQDEKGYFYYRQYPIGIKAKTPMLHWAQATMYKSMTLLLEKIMAL